MVQEHYRLKYEMKQMVKKTGTSTKKNSSGSAAQNSGNKRGAAKTEPTTKKSVSAKAAAQTTAETARKRKPADEQPVAEKKTAKPSAKRSSSETSKKPDVRLTSVAEGGAANKAPARTKTGKKATPAVELVTSDVAADMMALLCKRYPDAECELLYRNDYELLTSVILSAQTTDAQVNKVTPKLFARFPTPKSLAEADLDEIKEIVRPTGYYNAKANSIQQCAISVVTKFGGVIPKTLEELTTLPGVGRKTANVVLGVLHDVPAWTVDTHVQRLSRRFGFTREEDPYKIELDLQKLFPEKDWSQYSITIIWHGRRTCFAKNPDCQGCPISHLCPSSSL